MEKIIYFDNAATTYPKPECVYQAMDKTGRHLAVNAGRGTYGLAKKALGIIDETRALVRQAAGAGEMAEVVLTASATLACNQVLGGLEWKKHDVVYVTPFEHNAVMRVLRQLQKQYGFRIEELSVFPETLCMNMERIKFQFGKTSPSVVIMSHVSNVTGYIVPWEEIAKLAKQHEAFVIIDGSQALGLVPVNLEKVRIDFYIFAGHKTLYGPLGIGGYINHNGRKLKPVLAGGTGSDSLNLDMPLHSLEGYEPGSPNVIAAAGLHAALKEYLESREKGAYLNKEQELKNYLMKRFSKISGITLYTWEEENRNSATGIAAFNIEGYKASEIGMILDEDYGIAVRTGYHCAPLIHKYLKNEEYGGVVRVSIGRFNTREEIDILLGAIEEIVQE